MHRNACLFAYVSVPGFPDVGAEAGGDLLAVADDGGLEELGFEGYFFDYGVHVGGEADKVAFVELGVNGECAGVAQLLDEELDFFFTGALFAHVYKLHLNAALFEEALGFLNIEIALDVIYLDHKKLLLSNLLSRISVLVFFGYFPEYLAGNADRDDA